MIAAALVTLHADRSALAGMESFIVHDANASEEESEVAAYGDNEAIAYESSDIDWDALAATTAGSGLWLTVTGAGISTAVAIDTEVNQGYWLTHDLWGNESSIGNPYLDWRCAGGSVKYVYGHHLNSYGGFTPLAGVTGPDDLQALGEALLITADGVDSYTPAYALRVEESYLHLRYVPSANGLAEWLGHIRADSYCANPLVKNAASEASGVLVLMTCKNAIPGETERIAIVFIH